MSKMVTFVIWVVIFVIAFASIFLLEHGFQKIQLSKSGILVSATIIEVEPVPAESRSYHVVSYMYSGKEYSAMLPGAVKYFVGEKLLLVIDPLRPDSLMVSEKGQEMVNTLVFCFIGAIFIASFSAIILKRTQG